MPADEIGGFGTAVANTENVPSGSRLNGTWDRDPGTGQHPPGWMKAAKGRQNLIEPQERCRIGVS